MKKGRKVKKDIRVSTISNKTMSNDFKRIPYGISDFKQVRQENKYLVDKTMYFERMERAGNFLFLVRPRRFGKSL